MELSYSHLSITYVQVFCHFKNIMFEYKHVHITILNWKDHKHPSWWKKWIWLKSGHDIFVYLFRKEKNFTFTSLGFCTGTRDPGYTELLAKLGLKTVSEGQIVFPGSLVIVFYIVSVSLFEIRDSLHDLSYSNCNLKRIAKKSSSPLLTINNNVKLYLSLLNVILMMYRMRGEIHIYCK